MSKSIDAVFEKRIREIPIYQALQFEFLQIEGGICRVRVPRRKDMDGVFESYHGGLMMTVADSAACMAIMSQTGTDEKITTTDMNIRFLAPCLSDLIAEARVIKLGRTLCPVEVDLFDEQNKKVAVAQVTYIRLGK